MAPTTLAMNMVTYAPPSLTEPIGPLVWALEQPLIASLALTAAGVAIATVLARKGKLKPGLWAGAGLVVVALVVLVVGTVVETDRESIEGGSRAFVVAAVDGDIAVLDRLVLEEAALAASGQTVADDGRDRIEQLAAMQSEAGLIESWRLSRMQATIDGSNIGTTQFRVRATPAGGGPSLTWWRLSWRRDALGVWRIGTIDCLAVNGRKPGSGLYGWLGGATGGGRRHGR